jgi:hypothetical protein
VVAVSFGAFHDILVPEQVGIGAESGKADFSQQVAEYELPDTLILLVNIVDKVAFVPMINAEHIRAALIHLLIHQFYEAPALASQQLEIVVRDDTFEDEITLFAILAYVV